jgi:hypothetical protein
MEETWDRWDVIPKAIEDASLYRYFSKQVHPSVSHVCYPA